MKVFAYVKDGNIAIIMAFNRGHAVKLLAKELEARGLELSKENNTIVEIDIEGEKKGKALLLSVKDKIK